MKIPNYKHSLKKIDSNTKKFYLAQGSTLSSLSVKHPLSLLVRLKGQILRRHEFHIECKELKLPLEKVERVVPLFTLSILKYWKTGDFTGNNIPSAVCQCCLIYNPFYICTFWKHHRTKLSKHYCNLVMYKVQANNNVIHLSQTQYTFWTISTSNERCL